MPLYKKDRLSFMGICAKLFDEYLREFYLSTRGMPQLEYHSILAS